MKKWIRIIVTIGITVILFFVLQELMMPKYMNTSKEGALIGEYYDSRAGLYTSGINRIISDYFKN